jgi:3-oxoadipate enol-lactonase
LLSLTPTELREMPHGATLEYYVGGEGEPTTVFAHGLAGGIPDTRPLGSGVGGRKVFFQFRGHGRSDPPTGPIGYADLAADLRAVADEFGGTRAVGVSLGAGALCRLLSQTPERFDRLVFFLPAVLDEPRPAAAMARARALLEAVAEDDAPAAAGLLAGDIPAGLRDRPAAWRYVRERLDALLKDGLAPGLADLTEQTALPDRGVLASVKTPALVLGCRGDVAHPPALAEQLADVLPNATLHIYPQPAVLWTNRTDLRTRISEFLNS